MNPETCSESGAETSCRMRAYSGIPPRCWTRSVIRRPRRGRTKALRMKKSSDYVQGPRAHRGCHAASRREPGACICIRGIRHHLLDLMKGRNRTSDRLVTSRVGAALDRIDVCRCGIRIGSLVLISISRTDPISPSLCRPWPRRFCPAHRHNLRMPVYCPAAICLQRTRCANSRFRPRLQQARTGRRLRCRDGENLLHAYSAGAGLHRPPSVGFLRSRWSRVAPVVVNRVPETRPFAMVAFDSLQKLLPGRHA